MISVSCIAKNEAAVLPAFLAAVTPWADEVALVDTGSTDGTVAICRNAGDKVKVFPSAHYTKDTPLGAFKFNVARNEALAHCTHEWIVALDPDFTIPETFGAKLKEIIGQGRLQAYEIFLTGQGLRYAQCRVWPNRLGVCYESRHSAHEYVELPAGLPLERTALEVGHVGRPGDGAKQALLILVQDYHQGLRTSRLLYHLARAHYDDRDWPAAAAMYREFLTVVTPGDWAHYYGQVQLARTLYHVDLGQAWAAGLAALAIDSCRAEAYCILGDVALASNNMRQQAWHWYQLALTLPVPPGARYCETGCYRDYPLAQLTKLGRCRTPEGRHP